MTGWELAKTLTQYSERGQAYVDALHGLMKTNMLNPTDEAYLGDGPTILLIPVGGWVSSVPGDPTDRQGRHPECCSSTGPGMAGPRQSLGPTCIWPASIELQPPWRPRHAWPW